MRKIMDESGGRGKELVARPFTFITDDPSTVWDTFYRELKKYVVELVDGSPLMKFAGLTVEDLARDDDDVREKVLEGFAIYGSADDIVEKTAKLLKAGVTHVCFGHPLSSDPVEGCRQITEITQTIREQFRG
jgi:alkanesulfonate monooxygenase SsuD/methylene tetrahydromethanopterin reductase-like flavin-dependent oxidoreductase (luciferase family)